MKNLILYKKRNEMECTLFKVYTSFTMYTKIVERRIRKFVVFRVRRTVVLYTEKPHGKKKRGKWRTNCPFHRLEDSVRQGRKSSIMRNIGRYENSEKNIRILKSIIYTRQIMEGQYYMEAIWESSNKKTTAALYCLC